MTTQDKWYAGAGICLFGGFIMVATHDYINNISVSNTVSVLGYIIGLAGTVFCFFKAK